MGMINFVVKMLRPQDWTFYSQNLGALHSCLKVFDDDSILKDPSWSPGKSLAKATKTAAHGHKKIKLSHNPPNLWQVRSHTHNYMAAAGREVKAGTQTHAMVSYFCCCCQQ